MLRDVTIRLRANFSDLDKKIQASKANVRGFAKELENSAEKRQALNDIGGSFGKVGLAAGVAGVLAVRAFANFDEAMSAVAATGDDARNNLDALRDAAIDAGATTKYSATEAANAVENLAKAGISAKDILGGGLQGALDLAAAGNIEVADAAEYASIAMTQFKLKGADLPHVADLLAAGASKANGDVTDLGQALGQAGLVSSQMGLSIEETTGALSAMAQAGLLGSDAGTAFKASLQRLQNPSKESAGLMAQLGINAYDAQGNFVGLTTLAGQLSTAFEGQTQASRDAALAQIFGSDAIRAASVLYQEGADGIGRWIDQTNDAGFASETAAYRMDTLKGDIEQLSGSLETAFINTGAGADGPLRKMVQLLDTLVDAYNWLPGPVKSSALGFAGLTAAMGGTVFAATRVMTWYSNMKSNLTDLGTSLDAVNKKQLAMRGGAALAGTALLGLSGKAHEVDESVGNMTDVVAGAAIGFSVGGPWGAAIGAGVAGLGRLIAAHQEAEERVDALSQQIDAQTGALTDNGEALLINTLQKSGAYDAARELGISIETVTKAATGSAEELKELRTLLDLYVAAGTAATGQGSFRTDAAKNADKLRAIIGGSNEDLEKARHRAEEAAAATDALGEAQGETAGSTKRAGVETERTTGKVLDLAQSMGMTEEELKKQQDALSQTARGFVGLGDKVNDSDTSLADWTASLKAQAKALDEFTDNSLKAAKRGLDDGLIASLQEAGPEGALRMKQLANGTKSEIAAANKAWKSGEQAVDRYTSKIGGVPKTAGTKLRLDGTSDAEKALRSYKIALDNLPSFKTVTLKTIRTGTQKFADGGPVFGGTRGEDSVPALLMPGEHVLDTKDVDMLGGQAAVYRMRALAKSGVLRFAKGGAVGKKKTLYYEDKVASPLELTQLKVRIRDLERDLREKEKVGPKPKKGPDNRKTRDVLRGLDRLQAQQELAEARRELAEAQQANKLRKSGAIRRARDAKDKKDNPVEAPGPSPEEIAEVDRQIRLGEGREELRTDLRRGTIRDQVTGGLSSALGVVDRMLSDSKNEDLSEGARASLATRANLAEAALTDLYKQSEEVAVSLEDATKKRDELLTIRDSVASRLKGEFSLANLISGAGSVWGPQLTSGSLVSAGRAQVERLRTFQSKLSQLQKAGVAGPVLQEIAMMGTRDGIIAADILLNGPASDIADLNAVYADIGTVSNQAGQTVTEGFYQGGLSAADGLIKGLQDRRGALNQAIADIADGMILTLRQEWGIASPSKKMRALMQFVGDGGVLGIEDSAPKMQSAWNKMTSFETSTPPVYASVTRSASPTYTSATPQRLDISISGDIGVDTGSFRVLVRDEAGQMVADQVVSTALGVR